jgi:hypothetical protein
VSSAPVQLTHGFVAGQKLAYQVLTHLTAERRFKGLDTWFPSDLDLNYNFSYTVTKLQPDGVAEVHYLRPTITEVIGETSDSPPRDVVEKVNFNELLTVSPINEILSQKRVTQPEDFHRVDATIQSGLQSGWSGAAKLLTPYISEVHRLALFIGSVEDALDFSPKFPLNAVKPGDTWQKTVGYQPQKLGGASSKVALKRLDYTFTYVGPIQAEGKSFLRVEGKLSLSTDVAEYVKQIDPEQDVQTELVKAPLKFDSAIRFDLDPKTRDVIHAEGSTTGGYQLFTKSSGDTALAEERFKGTASMELTGRKVSH